MNLLELIEPLLNGLDVRFGNITIVHFNKFLKTNFPLLAFIEIFEQRCDLCFEKWFLLKAFDKLFYFDLAFVARQRFKIFNCLEYILFACYLSV
jgi:hypothetical protein